MSNLVAKIVGEAGGIRYVANHFNVPNFIVRKWIQRETIPNNGGEADWLIEQYSGDMQILRSSDGSQLFLIDFGAQ
jgi:hypothetical protein